MTTTNMNASLSANASVSSTGKSSDASWFEAMAEAWGKALDKQAARIEEMSTAIGDGASSPADITKLTAESLTMSFMSNSSHTALTSAGSALETMARKQ